MITLFILSYFLFSLGVIGISLTRLNILIVLISIEIIFFSICFSFGYATVYFDDIVGYLFSIYILTVAAAESAIGLAMLVSCYRIKGNISIYDLDALRG